MENKKQLRFLLFPGRNYQIGIPNSVNTPGAPHCSGIRIPFQILSSAVLTSLLSALFVTWHVLYLPVPLFSLCCISVQQSLTQGSTLCQELYLTLLSTEKILKYSFSSSVFFTSVIFPIFSVRYCLKGYWQHFRYTFICEMQ